MNILKIQEKLREGEKLTKKEADYYRERMAKIEEKARIAGTLTKNEEIALEEYENTHFDYEFNVIIEADRATQDFSDDEKKAIHGAVKKALNDLGYPDEDLNIG